jgi:hypothetical protein
VISTLRGSTDEGARSKRSTSGMGGEVGGAMVESSQSGQPIRVGSGRWNDEAEQV